MTTYVDERLPGGARHRAGFADPVQDAQSVFRAALAALARPTLPQTVTAAPQPPAPLSPEAAAVLLALCDEQTPIWLDAALRTADEVGAWLRFHTGARIVDAVGDALFVVASAPSTTPRLADLSAGTDEEPHRSATLLIDATGATGIGTFTVTGPGVDGSLDWDGSGLPAGFLAQWQQNHARFPRGVDVVLTDSGSIRALPRSTRLQGTENRSS
ncbi:MAG: phosphonate C-P lyase system protein PhnH [Microbacteriaceae bacterium]